MTASIESRLVNVFLLMYLCVFIYVHTCAHVCRSWWLILGVSLNHSLPSVLRQSLTDSELTNSPDWLRVGKPQGSSCLCPQRWNYSPCCCAQVLGVCWGSNSGLHNQAVSVLLHHYICRMTIRFGIHPPHPLWIEHHRGLLEMT